MANFDVPKADTSALKPMVGGNSSRSRRSSSRGDDTSDLLKYYERMTGQVISNATRAANRKPTKEEQKAQKEQQLNSYIAQLKAELQQMLDTNESYRNASYQRKNELLKNYRENVLPKFLESITDPQDRISIASALNNILVNAEKENDDAFSYLDRLGARFASFGKGIDNAREFVSNAARTGSQLTRNAQTGTENINRQELVNRANNDIALYEDIIRKLDASIAEAQSNNEPTDDLIAERDRTQQALDTRRQQFTQQLNAVDAQNAQNEQERFKQMLADMREALEQKRQFDKNERKRRADNKFYNELRTRDEELAAEGKWGLTDNAYKTDTVIDWLLTNAPTLALQAAATTAASAAGGPAAGTAVLSMTGALLSAGGVGAQIFDDVLNAPAEEIKKFPEYQNVYQSLAGKVDDSERDAITRAILAQQATTEVAGPTALASAIIDRFGPAAALAKGFSSRLATSSILKSSALRDRLSAVAKEGLKSGAAETVQENVENVGGNIGTGMATGQDVDPFANAGPTSLQAAIVGGLTGGLGGALQQSRAQPAGQQGADSNPFSGTETLWGNGPQGPQGAGPQVSGVSQSGGQGFTGAGPQGFTGTWEPGVQPTPTPSAGPYIERGQTIDSTPFRAPTVVTPSAGVLPQSVESTPVGPDFSVVPTSPTGGLSASDINRMAATSGQGYVDNTVAQNALVQGRMGQQMAPTVENTGTVNGPVASGQFADAILMSQQQDMVNAIRVASDPNVANDTLISSDSGLTVGDLRNMLRNPTSSATNGFTPANATTLAGDINNMLQPAGQQLRTDGRVPQNNELEQALIVASNPNVANDELLSPTSGLTVGDIRNMMRRVQNPSAAVGYVQDNNATDQISNMLRAVDTGVQNVDTRTNQGTVNADSQAAGSGQVPGIAVGPQNPTVVVRNGTTTQGARSGGTTRSLTGTVDPSATVNQAANRVAAGAGRRPGSTNISTTGTQSDIGQRGNAGQTVQRTGDSGSAADVGGSAQPGSVTEQTSPELGYSSVVSSEYEQSPDRADVTNRTHVVVTLEDSTSDVITPADYKYNSMQIASELVDGTTYLTQPGYVHELNKLRENLRHELDGYLKKHPELNIPREDLDAVADAQAQLMVRLENTLAFVLGRAIGKSLNWTVKASDDMPSDVLGQFTINGIRHKNGRFAKRGQAVISFKIDSNGAIDEVPLTLVHETYHAFVYTVCANANTLRQRALEGDTYAQQFLHDFNDFAHAVGVPENVDPLSLRAWHNKDGSATKANETGAIAFESYMMGKDPLPESSGLNSFYRGATNFFARVRKAYEDTVRFLADALRSLRSWFRGDVTAKQAEDAGKFEAYVYDRFNRGQFKNQEAVYAFFDNIVGETYSSIEKAYGGLEGVVDEISGKDHAAVDNEVAAQVLGFSLTNEFQHDGVALADAMRVADEFTAEKLRVSTLSIDEVINEAAQFNADRIDDTLQNNPVFYAMAEEGIVDNLATMELTTDADLYLQLHDLNEPIVDAQSDVIFNYNNEELPANQNTVVDIPPELQDTIVQRTVDEINESLQQGLLDDGKNMATEPWFSGFITRGGILDENGNPQVLYRTNHALLTAPLGTELEVATYARADNLLTKQDLDTVESSYKSAVRDIFNRLEQAAKDDKSDEVRFTTRELETLYSAGIDLIRVDYSRNREIGTVYYAPSLMNAADFVAGEQPVQLRAYKTRLRPRNNARASQPGNTQDALNLLADLISSYGLRNDAEALQKRYDKAVNYATVNSSYATADTHELAVTGPVKANWWMNGVTRIRSAFDDDKAYFRTWTVEQGAPTVGPIDSNPVWMNFELLMSRKRAVNNKIASQFQQPLDDFFTTNATTLGVDPDVLANDMGQLYRDMHILEASIQMERNLQQQISEAYAKSGGVMNQDVIDAETAFNNFQTAQQATPDATGKINISFPLPGGRTIGQCRGNIYNITEKYSDELVTNAVTQFQNSYRGLIEYAIREGAMSEEYVASFGNYSFYAPLFTQQEYDSSVINDLMALFPLKTDYARKGSVDPAMNSYDAFRKLSHRVANDIVSHDLGRELVAVNERNRDLYMREAYKQGATSLREDDDTIPRNQTYNGVTEDHYYLGTVNGEAVSVNYYNGMAVVNREQLLALDKVNKFDTDAQRQVVAMLLNKAHTDKENGPDLVVRVLRPQQKHVAAGVYQDTGVVDKSIPYVIIFGGNSRANRDAMTRVKKAFRSPFRTEQNTNVGRTVQKVARSVTSVFAQLSTTMRPLFPIFNSWRDMVDRVMFTIPRTYRTEDGNPVDGTAVAVRATRNLAYAPNIMRAILTGSVTGDSSVNMYVQEFLDHGIAQATSLQDMISRLENDMRVFFNEHGAKLDSVDGVTITEAHLRKLGIDDVGIAKFLKNKSLELTKTATFPFRKWAELWYSVPTFATYTALRQSGIKARDAAFYSMDMMNLEHKGSVTGSLSTFFPFISSIMETARNQIGSVVNLETFANIRPGNTEKYKGLMKLSASSALMFGGFSALIPMIASMFGDGDIDKGYKMLDSMDIASMTAIPIPVPGSEGLFGKVQLGFSLAMFNWQAAMATNRIARGTMTGSDAASTMIESFMHNMAPVPGPAWDVTTAKELVEKIAATCIPSVLAPVAYPYIFNKDYFGREIDSKYVSSGADNFNFKTEAVFRDLAKSLWGNTTPEMLKNIIKTYAAGPLQILYRFTLEDNTLKDPAYAELTSGLPGSVQALGGSLMMGQVGNYEQNLYFKASEAYDKAISDLGLTEVLKIPKDKRNSVTKAEWVASVLNQVGVDPRAIQDIMSLNKVQQSMKQNKQETNEQVKKLEAMVKNGLLTQEAYSATIRPIVTTYYEKNRMAVRECLSNLHYNKDSDFTHADFIAMVNRLKGSQIIEQMRAGGY